MLVETLFNYFMCSCNLALIQGLALVQGGDTIQGIYRHTRWMSHPQIASSRILFYLINQAKLSLFQISLHKSIYFFLSYLF